MFCVITPSIRPRRSSSASASWATIGPLVAERLEAGPVVRPEAGRVAFEDVDVGNLHRVDVGPEAGLRRAEVGNPGWNRDPGAGQHHGRARLADQLRQSLDPVRDVYLPLHFGVRLPRKAPMPSLASSLRKAVAKPCFSASMPSSRSPACGDALDLFDRERRLGGELAAPHQRGLEQLVIGDDAVDETRFERLARRGSRRRSGSSPAPCWARPGGAGAGCRRSRG